jgi:hypothetical protein
MNYSSIDKVCHYYDYIMFLVCTEQQVAQEQVLEILPMVTEVNAVSEELNKHRTFEVVLISAAAQEGQFGQNNAPK